MESKPYNLMPGGVVGTCAWCFPGDSILAKFPELAGRKVSHGICPAHKAEMFRQLDSIAHLGQKPAR